MNTNNMLGEYRVYDQGKSANGAVVKIIFHSNLMYLVPTCLVPMAKVPPNTYSNVVQVVGAGCGMILVGAVQIWLGVVRVGTYLLDGALHCTIQIHTS